MQSFYSKPLRPMRLPYWDPEEEEEEALNGAAGNGIGDSGVRASSSTAPPPTIPRQQQPPAQAPLPAPVGVAAAPVAAAVAPSRPSSGLARHTLAELRTLSFERWLAGLDASGALMRFHATLEENYDTVSQIAKTYVLSDGSFDVQFYDDVGATVQSERDLFRDALLYAMQGELGSLAGAGASWGSTSGGHMANGVAGRGEPLRSYATSSASGYGAAAHSNGCAPVPAAASAYGAAAQGNGYAPGPAAASGPQRQGDVQVPARESASLDWSHKERGARDLAGSFGGSAAEHQRESCAGAAAAAPAAVGAACPSSLSSIADWLDAYGLGAYRAALEDAGYDDLPLLRKLRAAELDEMLEAVVAKPGHRAKFRHAVEALREGRPA